MTDLEIQKLKNTIVTQQIENHTLLEQLQEMRTKFVDLKYKRGDFNNFGPQNNNLSVVR